MDFGEYPLLNTPSLTVVILKAAVLPDARLEDALARLHAALRAVNERPPFDDRAMRARLRAVADALAGAGLLQQSSGGRMRITALGRRALLEHPAGFDTADLVDAMEIRRRREARRRAPASDPRSARYEDGYDAFRMGIPITENPFRQDSVDHRAWEDGWCEARDDATPGATRDDAA